MSPELIRQEWVEFDHATKPGWRWRIDVTTMLSGFGCIWQNGCRGHFKEAGPDGGCCSKGAYFDDEDPGDFERTVQRVAELKPDQWQFFSVGQKRWFSRQGGKDSQPATRVYKGGCIFWNRPGHPRPGCAFHIAALDAGQSHVEWKPTACWQTPLFTTVDDENQVITLHKEQQRDWVDDETDNGLDWWCGDDMIAFDSTTPFYQRHQDELRAILGERLLGLLNSYLDQRTIHQMPHHVPVQWITRPHPPIVKEEEEPLQG